MGQFLASERVANCLWAVSTLGPRPSAHIYRPPRLHGRNATTAFSWLVMTGEESGRTLHVASEEDLERTVYIRSLSSDQHRREL